LGFALGVILEDGHLLGHFLLVEDVVGGLALGPLVLSRSGGYRLAGKAAGGGVELGTVGLLACDEGVGGVEGVGEVVVQFGGGEFGRIGVGALSG
jgi:hypothetical protein